MIITLTIKLQNRQEEYRIQMAANILSQSFLRHLPEQLDLYVGEDTHYWGYLSNKLEFTQSQRLKGLPEPGLYYVPKLQTITIYYRKSPIPAPNDLYLLGEPVDQLEVLATHADEVTIRCSFKI
ncbi:cyclophilin-like fold protein [Companilactobacillus nantensis]|uniref:cyclophilin-like fold protein n=1 Tax=Companilactobacillus nantensis TaxID=305793 RepID=UPI00070E98EC|nr:hypothetical protein LNA01_03460 [Companilactobacillus nantensis]